MSFFQRILHETRAYVGYYRLFKPNIRYLLLATILSGLGWGIFSVDFNLYILSLGFNPADLGVVLSMAPLAQILAAIPIGFIAELVGYRRVYLIIFLVTGIMQMVQASASILPLISAAAFIFGLAASGSFVIKLPFLNANVESAESTHVFSADGLLQGAALAVGALVAGYLPGWLSIITPSTVLQYRYTLYLGGGLTLLSLLPLLAVREQPAATQRKISLEPYLWGIDRLTKAGAFIEFFLGLTFGLIIPFMNVYFIYHLGTSREYFSGVEALVWIPTTIALALGPLLARRLGTGESITLGRLLIPLFPLILGFSQAPLLGASAYWCYRAIFSVTQSNWFSLAMSSSAPRSRVAISAWLEITFQVGMAIAALVAGRLLAEDNYLLPFLISSGSAILAVLLTWVLIVIPLRQVRGSKTAG